MTAPTTMQIPGFRGALIALDRPDPTDNEAHTRWARDCYAAMPPHSGSERGYIDLMSGDADHRGAERYGANHERLAAVMAASDSDNLFHVDQSSARANGR